MGGDGYVSIFITDFTVYSHITHKTEYEFMYMARDKMTFQVALINTISNFAFKTRLFPFACLFYFSFLEI